MLEDVRARGYDLHESFVDLTPTPTAVAKAGASGAVAPFQVRLDELGSCVRDAAQQAAARAREVGRSGREYVVWREARAGALSTRMV